MKARIFLVRHGLSEFNIQGRLQGSSDTSRLSAAGREMAKQAGKKLSDIEFNRVLSSPLARARETTELIMLQGSISSTVDLVDDLRETDLYQWEGRTMKEIIGQQPEQFHAWKHDPVNFHFSDDGETVYPIRDLYDRCKRFWTSRLSGLGPGNHLLVSHGGTIQGLINTALGVGVENHHVLQQSNCGISCLEFDPGTHIAKLVQLNDTSAQKFGLPKLKADKNGLRIVCCPIQESFSEQDLKEITQLTGIQHVFVHNQIALEPSMTDMAVRFEDTEPMHALLNNLNSEPQRLLENLLLVAPSTVMKKLLIECLQLNHDFVSGSDFLCGTLSVMHRVSSHPVAIVQCLNFPRKAAASESVV